MLNMDEIDPDFEPQDRPRSCTWPSLRRPEFLDKKPSLPGGDQQGQGAQQLPVQEEQVPTQAVASPPIPTESKVDLTTPATQRKNGSRRNAWGNLSYADLITKAIQGAPDQRLTLAQIYEWMVKNVPFFKDKGDSNSSAGWKNSIRHNLSLHSRFVRVQNEGTGKSSWWMINPDAKPGKSSRRRSSSMDGNNAKWDKKRGRAKKKAEEKAKNCYPNLSPKIEGADDQNSLPFSLGDFRSRSSSNASSSCSRLSPILARDDLADMHDREAPPMSPPIPFVDHIEPSHHFDAVPDSSHTAELANLASLSLNPGMNSPLRVDHMDQLPVPNFQANGGGHYHNGGASNGYSIYSPQGSTYSNSELSPGQNGVQSPYSSYSQPATPVMSPMSQPRQCSPINGDIGPSFIPQSGLLSQSASILSQENILSRQSMMQTVIHNQSVQPSCREESNMVRRSPASSLHRYGLPGQHQLNAASVALAGRVSSHMDGGNTSLHAYQHHAAATMPTCVQHQNGPVGSIPTDLNNLELSGSGFDYDFDSFLRNEMAQGEGEGFSNVSFENINTGNAAPPPATMGTNWVH